MYDMDECYRILELAPGAAAADIHQAYRDLLMVWHPDRFPGNPRLQRKAQQKTADINEAYQRLQSSLRANYAEASPFTPHDEWYPAEQPPDDTSACDPQEQNTTPRDEPETTVHRRPSRAIWISRCATAAAVLLLAIAVTMGIISNVNEKEMEVVVIKRQIRSRETRLPQTLEAYQEAVWKNPKDSTAHYRLGEAYVALGRHDDALAAFRDAVRFRPDYAEAYDRLGQSYAALGRHDQAIEVYKQAILIKPDFASAHYHLSESYWRLGRYHDANDAYTRALLAAPEDDAAYRRFTEQGQRGVS